MYLITVPFVLSLFLAWTLIPSNVAGRTKKTLVASATFVGYVSSNTHTPHTLDGTSSPFPSSPLDRVISCTPSQSVGNMTGSQIFQTKDAPRYISGTIGCAICFGAECILISAWRLYYMWQNRRRDRAAAASGIAKDEQERLGREMGERDVTDLQNPYFRYTM